MVGWASIQVIFMAFRTMAVDSAKELVGLLAGLKEEENDDTLLLGPRWDQGRFARKARSARALVSDNDGTVIAGSQWLDMRTCMTETHQAADAEDAASYFRGDRTDEGDVRFIFASVNRLRQSGVTECQLRRLAAEQKPRGGVQKLFRSFARGNTALVSFGLRSYPSAWADHHDVPVGEVHALNLTWREEDGMRVLDGCDASTVVTEATKGRARARFCAARNVEEQDVIVLEDTPRMLVRMRHADNLAILIIPRHGPQPMRTEERLRQLGEDGHFEGIDGFLVADDWHLLVAMRRGEF